MAKKTETKRQAGWQLFITRFPQAMLLWNTTDAAVPVAGELRAYALAGRVVIIHDYANDHGWTAYVDPFTGLKIDETFDAIAKHCDR